MMLVTLNKLLQVLKVEVDTLTEEEVQMFNNYIARSSEFIESYCKVKFKVQEFEQTYRGNGQKIVALTHSPLLQVLSSELPYWKTSDLAIYLNEKAPKGFFKVAYRYGYEAVPGDIEQACIELVLWKYKLHEHVHMKSVAQDGATAQYQVDDIPAFIKVVLDNYRKKVSFT